MALFGFGKKKDKEEMTQCDCKGGCKSEEIVTKKVIARKRASSCCGGDLNAKTMAQAESLKNSAQGIQVLGSGCTKCNQLETAVKEALAELGTDEIVGHVTDFAQIAAYGVMTTPALVIDGKVVSYGKVLKKEEVLDLIQKNRG